MNPDEKFGSIFYRMDHIWGIFHFHSNLDFQFESFLRQYSVPIFDPYLTQLHVQHVSRRNQNSGTPPPRKNLINELFGIKVGSPCDVPDVTGWSKNHAGGSRGIAGLNPNPSARALWIRQVSFRVIKWNVADAGGIPDQICLHKFRAVSLCVQSPGICIWNDRCGCQSEMKVRGGYTLRWENGLWIWNFGCSSFGDMMSKIEQVTRLRFILSLRCVIFSLCEKGTFRLLLKFQWIRDEDKPFIWKNQQYKGSCESLQFGEGASWPKISSRFLGNYNTNRTRNGK